MTWSLSTVNVKDATGTSKGIIQATDGTNFAPGVAILDGTGGLITTANPLGCNLAQVAGSATATGHGTASGAIRVELPTDGTGLVSANITKVGGSAVALGSTTGSASIPVVIASDQVNINPVPTVAAGAGFTRPADTTAYAFGDLVANSTTAGSVVLDTATVAKANDQAFTLVRCRLIKSGTTITGAIFRVHIYNVASPTFANGDNGAWSSNNYNNYLGAFDVTVDKAMTDGAFGVGSPQIGPYIIGKPISGAQTIAYTIEARAAYTPANSETFKAIFEVL